MSQMGGSFTPTPLAPQLCFDTHIRVLDELRQFCSQAMLYARGATILPMPQNRDQFIVRAADYGLE
jgi:hypothetical protein